MRISTKLFATASSPSLPATHRVAAWNTLCAFVDQLAASQLKSVQDLLWEHEIWLKACNLYIADSQHARPKSSKQLLVTLANALHKRDHLADIQGTILRRAAENLGTDEQPKQLKAFLQLLAHFISKDLLDVESINDALPVVTSTRHETRQDMTISRLLSRLFRWASYEDFGSVAGRCISVVLDKRAEYLRLPNEAPIVCSNDVEPPIWSHPLDDVLESGYANIDQLRVHVFPILFKRSLSQYVHFLRTHGLEQLVRDPPDVLDEPEHCGVARLLCAALQTGKELGLILETADKRLVAEEAVLHVPIKALHSLLRSHDRSIRITGLNILINSPSTTRPFLPQALVILKARLSSLFADTDANFRSEVFSSIQRLMDRLRAITAALVRANASQTERSSQPVTESACFRRHRDFVHWLIRFVTWELRPTASYQRHISALKSLSIISRSGVDRAVSPTFWSKSASAETKWPFNVTIFPPEPRRILLDLLVDPFDDVRQTAASILSVYAKSAPYPASTESFTSLKMIIERAEKAMLASGRADQADGVAHMYSLLALDARMTCKTFSQNVPLQLMDDLSRILDKAQQNLTDAARRYPMHGLLTSIRVTFAQEQALNPGEDELGQLVDCLHRVWQVVNPVLCSDAPEGYEPDDDSFGAESSSKGILSYCWRALKESSLLLGSVIKNRATNSDIALSLSHLCFTQLAELRHRGAFSTVAQTWTLCCNRMIADMPAPSLEPSPLEQWYDQTFDILTTRTTINTRRSAGIPSLFCGLLIAEKHGAMLQRAFQDLSTIAQQPVDVCLANESSLPQVHALNCVKDILKNTRLGEQSERYVPASMQLAADSLRSDAWAIRNCGLMLFRGVIDRLLGTSDAYLEDDAMGQKRISVQQHPELLDIVLQLLTNPTSNMSRTEGVRYEGVFPALQMLQRMSLPSSQKRQAQQVVLALTASASWHVRDKAARTFASLADDAEAGLTLENTLQARVGHENAMHGVLLCLKYLTAAAIEPLSQSAPRSHSIAPISHDQLCTILRIHSEAFMQQFEYAHPTTKAAWHDALVEYMRIRYHASGTSQYEDVHELQNPTIPADFLARLSSMLQVTTADWIIEAVERASLARALACQLVWGLEICPLGSTETVKVLLHTLLALAERDADACVEFWRTLRTESGMMGRVLPEYLKSQLLSTAASILRGGFQLRAKCEAQALLIFLLESDVEVCEELLAVCAESSSPLAAASNQTYADQWLQLHAAVVDGRLCPGDQTDLIRLISTCKQAIAGLGLFTREATALALGRMHHIWPLMVEHKGTFACDIYFIIFDLLNDDDEDIRLSAATIVSRILQSVDTCARQTHFEPLTASQRLQQHMLASLDQNRTFAIEAFSRAFPDLNDTVVDSLHTFSQPDTALFATEKQNLYIDPAREVHAWSQILLRIPAPTLPKHLIKALTFWVDEGLYTLSSRLGKGLENGALGWTSHDRTFVLGLQVIYAVEVLVGYVQKGGKLGMECSEIVRKLVLFGQALQKAGEGNVLWKWEVQRVLNGVVEGRVRLAWELARMVREAGVKTM